MRYLDKNTEIALLSSRPGDYISVYAWYNGESSWDGPLPVSSWQMSWDCSRQVQTATFEIKDSTGELAPWLLEDPLGVGGARLRVVYHVGGAGPVNMGWYRITNSDPDEVWRGYVIDSLGQINANNPLPKNKAQVFATGGATIQVQAADLAVHVKNNRLLAPESPKTATVVSELKRLLKNMLRVVVLPGVTDRAINTQTIYEQERLDAVEDLCGILGAAYRLNGAGQFEVYSLAIPEETVWTIRGGDEGALVSVNRQQTLDGLYNVFVAEGTSVGTKPIPVRGIAMITSGAMSVKGPHGFYPTFYNSSLITTQRQANDYAIQMRDTALRGMTTELSIQCLPHPGLQQGDWVTVATPVVNNQTIVLKGKVKKMDLRSQGASVAPMDLIVECAYVDVQRAMQTIARNESFTQ